MITTEIKTIRETTIKIPKGATLWEVYKAVRDAEGGMYRIVTETILVFREDN